MNKPDESCSLLDQDLNTDRVLTYEYRKQENGKIMIVTRWQATILPTLEQAMQLLQNEGLNATLETVSPEQKTGEHRHPFDEVRLIVEGEMLYNVAGNQLLLRPGDRIEIPTNTRHSHSTLSNSNCLSVVGMRPF